MELLVTGEPLTLRSYYEELTVSGLERSLATKALSGKLDYQEMPASP